MYGWLSVVGTVSVCYVLCLFVVALSMAASEAVWLKGIHQELVPGALEVLKIHCDNKGAHFNTASLHAARGRISAGDIEKVASQDMNADCLTKRLSKDAHNKCVRRLGLVC